MRNGFLISDLQINGLRPMSNNNPRTALPAIFEFVLRHAIKPVAQRRISIFPSPNNRETLADQP